MWTFFFSNIYCGNLVKFLGGKVTVLWVFSYDWVSLRLLTLRIVFTKPPFISYSSGFYPGTGSHRGFLSASLFWSNKHLLLVFMCLSLQSQMQRFALCTPLSLPLMDLSRNVQFVQSVQHFTCCWDPVLTSMLLTCRTKPESPHNP